MNHTHLVAKNASDYESMVVRLLSSDDAYWSSEKAMASDKARTSLHKNAMAAEEWAIFLRTAITSLR